MKQLKHKINKANHDINKTWFTGILAMIILILLTLCWSNTNAQSITKDANGNYHAVKKAKDTTELKWSGHTYTDTNGKEYQVYISPRVQKLYINRVSKKGNTYKYYLPTNDKP